MQRLLQRVTGRLRTGYRGSHYAIVDVDRSASPEPLQLGPEQDGVAVIVRDDGRPADFLLQHAGRGALVDLRALIADALPPSPSGDASEPGATGTARSITIAICTHQRADLLAECLDSVAEKAAGPSVEVLVIDNAPRDGTTRAAVAAHPGVRYAVAPVPGLDLARNRAIAEARGDVVAFLDDDAVVDAGWLVGLRSALAAHPDAAAVTGPVLPRELDTPARIAFERRGGFVRGWQRVRYEGDRHEGQPLFPCGVGIFGAGCNMVVRRSAVIGIGGFDEALDTGAPLPGGGDIDMFYRVIRHAGPLVYEPRLLVFHRHRDTHAGLRRQYWTWGVGFAAFAHKTLRDDPPMRGRMLRMLRWWSGYMLREVRGSLRPGSGIPPSLPTAELLGGLAGILTAYPASRRRMRRLHATHAAREAA